jgi:hypothetical protein
VRPRPLATVSDRPVLQVHDIGAVLSFARFQVVLQECGHLDGFLNAFQAVRVGLPISRMGQEQRNKQLSDQLRLQDRPGSRLGNNRMLDPRFQSYGGIFAAAVC